MRKLRLRRTLVPSKLSGPQPVRFQRSDPKSNDKEDSRGSNRSTLRPLPLPSIYSPPHPSAFRFGVGLYKYATGVLGPWVRLYCRYDIQTDLDRSNHIRRTLDATRAAFKVYSTDDLSQSQCRNIRELASTEDSHRNSGSLQDTLRRLCHLTVGTYAVAESIVGSFFQLFRDRESLGALRLPWGIIEPVARRWNLSCETYRADRNAPMSTAHITLTIPSCAGLRTTTGNNWDAMADYLQLAVTADLRPTTLHETTIEEQPQARAAGTSHDGFIQRIVDDIVCTTTRVILGYQARDPTELLSRLKTAIIPCLKGSPLASFVDFKSLEIRINDVRSQRYVSNVLLTHDGNIDHRHSVARIKQGLEPAYSPLTSLNDQFRQDDHATSPSSTNLSDISTQEADAKGATRCELEMYYPIATLPDQELSSSREGKETGDDAFQHAYAAEAEILEMDNGTKPVSEQNGAQEKRKSDSRIVFIALGSNVGDRFKNIENACREIDADPDMRIVRTSHLYETAPMYVEDQDAFLNGACRVRRSMITYHREHDAD